MACGGECLRIGLFSHRRSLPSLCFSSSLRSNEKLRFLCTWWLVLVGAKR
ncbi:hypothetical protein LINPERPRIM_LOCUS39189 [Linum perenne]